MMFFYLTTISIPSTNTIYQNMCFILLKSLQKINLKANILLYNGMYKVENRIVKDR